MSPLPIKPIPLFPGHIRPEPVVSELCAQRKRLREERKRILIAHAVQTVGVVVVLCGLGPRLPVLQPSLGVGGQVASIVGEVFGELTLRVGQPAAKPVVSVVPLPVIGHATVNFCVVTNKVVVKANRLLTGGMDYPWFAIKG